MREWMWLGCVGWVVLVVVPSRVPVYRLTCVFMAWKKAPELVIPLLILDIFRS